MRSTFRAALAVPFVLLSSACAFAQPARGSAAAGEQQRQVGDFQRVHVASGLKATVTPGATSVRLSGDESLLALIETEVDDGELTVRLKRGHSVRTGGVTIALSTPRLTAVEASGGSTVEAQVAGQDAFATEASGGSVVQVRELDAGSLAVEASGGSRVTLQGRAGNMAVEASGGSVVRADGLQLASLAVEASGGARVEAGPSESLAADVSGGSLVRLSRQPARRAVETSGGGEVVQDK